MIGKATDQALYTHGKSGLLWNRVTQVQELSRQRPLDYHDLHSAPSFESGSKISTGEHKNHANFANDAGHNSLKTMGSQAVRNRVGGTETREKGWHEAQTHSNNHSKSFLTIAELLSDAELLVCILQF